MCLQMYSNLLTNSHSCATPKRRRSVRSHRGNYYFNFGGHLFVIITVLLISPCLCKPKNGPWWTQACHRGPSYRTCIDTPNLRHGRSPAQNQVQDQLKILINEVSINRKFLQKVYTNITRHHIPDNAKIKELNLRKMVMKMWKRKSRKWVIFHYALQKIARFLDKLIRTRNNSEGTSNTDKRNCYMSQIIYSLQALLCEVSEYIEDTGLKPRQIRGHLKGLNSMDTTNLFIHDMTALRKMLRFLKDSQEILIGGVNKVVRTRRLR